VGDKKCQHLPVLDLVGAYSATLKVEKGSFVTELWSFISEGREQNSIGKGQLL